MTYMGKFDRNILQLLAKNFYKLITGPGLDVSDKVYNTI